MQRAALYIRVSTEEQAQHGYSLDAQRQALTAYANKNEMAIVGYYIDDGHSARKKYTSRKEFMRMLGDVRQNKIDIILFIKLDRWFRSVKDYYKIQEILEAHNVGWKTTEENYDTTTTNGRLYINIRLSVAQDESDRTSDRIKFVFDNKVAKGEVITGARPPGLRIEGKRLVHDEEKKGMVIDLFQYFALHQSKYASVRYIYEKYGVRIEKSTMKNMLTNTLYIGQYRDNPDFCEPMIDRELFENVQEIIKSKEIRKPRTGRVYIFTGLVRCAECGRVCGGRYVFRDPHEYYHYRCCYAMNTRICRNRITINEKHIEEWLLENICDEAGAFVAEYNARMVARPKQAPDRAKIKRRLAKLKELYLNELISIEEYRADYEMYNARLMEGREPRPQGPDIKSLNDFLGNGFREVYHSLDRRERQTLWRGIIKEIRVDTAKNIKIFFI